MRRVMVSMAAAAVLLVSANLGLAQGWQQISVDNTEQSPQYTPGNPYIANYNSPMATTGGALWIDLGSKTVQYGLNGSGSPETDFNIQLNAYCPTSPGSSTFAWYTLGTVLLSSTNTGLAPPSADSAAGDYTTWSYPGDNYCYPGMFTAYHLPGGGLPGLPNTNNLTGPNWDYNMELYFWTGNYNSYAAAEASNTTGVYAGDSGIFSQYVPFGNGMPPPIPGDLDDMPATIMYQVPVLIPGDANGDGKVDINDLTIVLAHYNQTGMAWSQGEFTGSGTVDINDLTIVLAHYNDTSGAAPAAVPEPASAVLLVCCGLAALWAAVRRRRR